MSTTLTSKHRPERQSIQTATIYLGRVIPSRTCMIHADASLSPAASLALYFIIGSNALDSNKILVSFHFSTFIATNS